MKKLITLLTIVILCNACKNKAVEGSFTVQGNIKNVENQKVFLEQLFFSIDQNPQVIDTADVVNGKFDLNGICIEDGLFRLRFANTKLGYVFINDKADIKFTANANDSNINVSNFETPANKEFHTFLTTVDAKQKGLNALSAEIETLGKSKKNDTLIKAKNIQLINDINSYKKYIIKTIDSASNPIVAAFALGYTRGINPDELKNIIPNLTKRFPTNQSIASTIKSYNELIAVKNNPLPITDTTNAAKIAEEKQGIQIGDIAYDFSLADVDGKQIALSSFRGKYVLVDFWASWCGPCRAENPNVVANYNAFKNKNFTVLGVSLDEDKTAWQEAIKADKLTWTHISDLKGWGNAAAKKYGVEAIPFNVLVDPNGKIIAKDLRDNQLSKKLTEALGK